MTGGVAELDAMHILDVGSSGFDRSHRGGGLAVLGLARLVSAPQLSRQATLALQQDWSGPKKLQGPRAYVVSNTVPVTTFLPATARRTLPMAVRRVARLRTRSHHRRTPKRSARSRAR